MQFNTVEHTRQHERARIAADLAALYTELSAPVPEERFSPVRAINAMAERDFHVGKLYEAGVCAAAAAAQGGKHDPQRAVFPWSVWARDLNATTPSAGANLVGARTTSALDVLRPYSLVARAGITVLENQVSNLLIPTVTTPVTGSWLSSETSELTASDAVIGVTSSRPKTGGAVLKASFNFMKQGTQSDDFMREQILGAAGALLDEAVLAGTGSSGQPTGLANAGGVPFGTGDFSCVNALGMETAILEAGGDEEKLRFLVSPSQRNFLKQKEGLAWDRQILEGGKIVDIPVMTHKSCPSSSIFLGDWSKCVVAFWGSGIEVHVDPYTAFKTGAVSVRVLLFVDVTFPQPGAFFRWVDPT